MIAKEIVYGSLAEAREHGPGDVLIRAVEEGWRLVTSPTYCERDGQGVCAFDIAGEPAIEDCAEQYKALASVAGVTARAVSEQPAVDADEVENKP